MSLSDNSTSEHYAHGGATEKKLVYMANQIGTFFKSQDADTAAAKIADHIKKYWDPRMIAQIFAHLKDGGGAGFDPAVRRALETLQGSAANS